MDIDEADKAVGLRVQAAREDNEYNQSQLAAQLRKAGLPWSQGTLSRVETGQRAVRLTEAVVLAQVLGIGLTGLVPSAGGLESALARACERENQARRHVDLSMTGLKSAWNLAQALRLAAALQADQGAVYEVDRSAPRFLWDATAWSPLEDVSAYDLLEFFGFGRNAIESMRADARAFLEEYSSDTGAAFEALSSRCPGDFVMPGIGPGSDDGAPGHGELGLRYVLLTAGGLLQDWFPGVTFRPSSADHDTLRERPINITGMPPFPLSQETTSDAAPSA